MTFWDWLKSLFTPKPQPPKLEVVKPVKTIESVCLEFHAKAMTQLGNSEIKTPKTIIGYAKYVLLKVTSVKTAWCAIFANWVIFECGYRGNKSAWARDFLQWGVPLDKKVKGCIGVFERNGPGGDSHVCFWDHGEYWIGGNQQDAVSIARQDPKKLLGLRGPKL